MDHRFKAEEWDALTPAERVDRCRLWAADAQEMVKKAPPELKQTYQNIADSGLRWPERSSCATISVVDSRISQFEFLARRLAKLAWSMSSNTRAIRS